MWRYNTPSHEVTRYPCVRKHRLVREPTGQISDPELCGRFRKAQLSSVVHPRASASATLETATAARTIIDNDTYRRQKLSDLDGRGTYPPSW